MASDDGGGDAVGFHWRRWTAIGCLAWIALMALSGAPFTAIFLTPVVGPLGGWLIGGTLFLVGGVVRNR